MSFQYSLIVTSCFRSLAEIQKRQSQVSQGQKIKKMEAEIGNKENIVQEGRDDRQEGKQIRRNEGNRERYRCVTETTGAYSYISNKNTGIFLY